MVKQYKIYITSDSSQNFQYSFAYPFYGMLMETIDTEYASYLHVQDINPVNQYVTPILGKNEALWTINLLGEQAIEKFSTILDSKDNFFMDKNKTHLNVISREYILLQSGKDVVDSAQTTFSSSDFILRFNSPTSFKSNDEYMLFPSVNHIVNSLVNKWSAYSSDFTLNDEDAIKFLINGIKIRSYHLQSSYYRMKGNVIPGFIGDVSISAKLPAPLLEIMKLLLYFASFSGIGIKTSLGMGGVTVGEKIKRDSANPKQT